MNSGSAKDSDGGGLHARLRRLFVESTRRLHVQLLRYVVVGGVATLADFAVYVLLVKLLGLHYLLGNAGGFSVGVLVNYLMSIWWVFPSRRLRSKSAEFVIFALIGMVGLGISELCMVLGVSVLGIYDLLTKVGATVCTLAWNFTVRRWLLFRDRN